MFKAHNPVLFKYIAKKRRIERGESMVSKASYKSQSPIFLTPRRKGSLQMLI
jgi:hypothetical protein